MKNRIIYAWLLISTLLWAALEFVMYVVLSPIWVPYYLVFGKRFIPRLAEKAIDKETEFLKKHPEVKI